MRSRTLIPPRAAWPRLQRSPPPPRSIAHACRSRRVHGIRPSRLRALGLRVKQPVQVHDEIAHLGIVDRALRLGFPGRVGAGVIWIDADNVEPVEVPKLHAVNMIKFAAEDEVKELLCWLFREVRHGTR